MDFQLVVSETSRGGLEEFWRATGIWLKNPHLVNRRVSSCVNILTATVKCKTAEMIDALSKVESVSEILECGSKSEVVRNLPSIADKCTPVMDITELTELTSGGVDSPENSSVETYLLVNKYLPRDSVKFSPGIEFTIVDKELKRVLSHHRNADNSKRCLGLSIPYELTFDDENRFGIGVKRTNDDFVDPSVRWLRQRLFPRLLNWMEKDRSNKDSLVDGSLNLVSPEKYTHLYNRLKQKYGSEMVKKWPECTDPKKFVYEDVAIATYLILLWENDGGNERKQSFVDLGCGNGLLVYILTSEGHSGMGIDLRKRKIWDIYPSTTTTTTRLVEETIVPSSSSLFPKVDWLIGNHSDELTPWIPVIAARSSYTCRFFLLPCCAHEFDGTKFQRDRADKSQYFEYIKYVKSVCEGCGFKTKLDRLRIPSTKRICLIGGDRNYPREKSDVQDCVIDEIIEARSRNKRGSRDEDTIVSKKSQWSSDFKPRDSVEPVRNCTRIDRAVVDEIINAVTSELLRKTKQRDITGTTDKTWNVGGRVELAEITKLVPSETLKQLRNECGGLRTLLRNNGNIFRVIDGSVEFRIPGTVVTSNKSKKGKTNARFKVKPCWFHENHPDGCPLSDQLCTFKH